VGRDLPFPAFPKTIAPRESVALRPYLASADQGKNARSPHRALCPANNLFLTGWPNYYFNLRESSWPRSINIQIAGSTSSVKTVAVTRPPRTTGASGF